MANNYWHSTKEKLPNIGEVVVILLNGRTPSIATFDELGFIEDGLLHDHVTHWLRLPRITPLENTRKRSK